MKWEAIIKIAAFALLSIVFLLICFRLIIKKILSDHKFFTIISKKFYNYFYSIKKISHLRTNNFGYAPVDKEVAGYHPDLQYGLQLYKELVKNHNGYLINANHSVVEVGCGRGAGAEF